MTSNVHAIQYYPVARLAHLERNAQATAALLYSRHRGDWDAELAGSVGAQQVTMHGALWAIWRAKPHVLELPEPLAIALVPQILTMIGAVRIADWLRRRKTLIATYAIENLDPSSKAVMKTRLPSRLVKPVVNVVLGTAIHSFDRIAFGTEGAKDLYSRYAPRLSRRAEARTFLALPQPNPNLNTRKSQQVYFVGTFDDRKGVIPLLDSWPEVARAIPSAKLLIHGYGPLESQVAERAAEIAHVEVVVSPPRQAVLAAFDHSKVVVLLSQRTPLWREQVGLPIVEGLAAGCVIVTTAETGLADWLRNGTHEVLDGVVTVDEVEAAILRALRSPATPRQVVESLPSRDSRAEAELWLHRPHAED